MALVRRAAATGRAPVPSPPPTIPTQGGSGVVASAPVPVPAQPGHEMAAAAPSLPAKAWGVTTGLGLAAAGALGAWNIHELAPTPTFRVGEPMAIFGALLGLRISAPSGAPEIVERAGEQLALVALRADHQVLAAIGDRDLEAAVRERLELAIEVSLDALTIPGERYVHELVERNLDRVRGDEIIVVGADQELEQLGARPPLVLAIEPPQEAGPGFRR